MVAGCEENPVLTSLIQAFIQTVVCKLFPCMKIEIFYNMHDVQFGM